jgi:GAF domain-containing protein
MSASAELCDPVEFTRLKRRLDRERAARLEMEATYEQSLRSLYLREQELRLLQDIATAANLSQSVRDVFQYALARICEYLAWPIGHAYLAEESAGAVLLRPMALWHIRDPQGIAPFRAMTDAHDLAPGEGLPGRVYLSKTVTWLSDLGADAAFPRELSASQSGISTGCAVPVLVGEEPVAILEFYTDRIIERDEALLQLMPQVATHLGRAMERQRAEDRLTHDASHDPLTGLPNRALFLDRLNQAIAHARHDGGMQFAVLFIDLDRFKIVNDSLGHLAGDNLIVQVAGRLKDAMDERRLLADTVTHNAGRS